MNNFDLRENFKLVVYGGILSIVLGIIGYAVYLKLQIQNTDNSSSSYLSGENFNILIKFKDNNVSYKDIDVVINNIFKDYTTTVPAISPSADKGRTNPFTP